MQDRVQTACLVTLTAIAVGATLYWLRPLMIPFTLAVFVTLSFQPLLVFQMKRLRVPYWIAVLFTLVLALCLLFLLGSLVAASVGQLSANSEAYARQLGKLLEQGIALLPEEAAQEFESMTSFPVRSVGGMLVGTTNAIVDVMSKSMLVLIFVVFLLISGAGTREATGVWREAEIRVERYLVTKAVISAVTGCFVGTSLALLGVDLALTFGLFAFLLNFIPNIGSIVATLLPLPVVLMDPELSWKVAVLAIALPGTVQLTLGNFVEPRVMGSALDLHPVTILLALIFWGMLWGVVGALLATPITAVFRIVLGRFEGSRFLADLLAGRIEVLRSG